MRALKRENEAEGSKLCGRLNSLRRLIFWFCVFSFSLSGFLSEPYCRAVTSRLTRQSSSKDLLKGRTENVVVGSDGTLQLGRAAEVIIENFEDPCLAQDTKKSVSRPWSINSIVASGGTIYLGTSPNGGIYRYALGKLMKIYPAEPGKGKSAKTVVGIANRDSEIVETQQYLANEHIFAMTTDISGRLLAAVSGDKCVLYRFESGKIKEPKVIFEPDDAKYIFAIAIDVTGNIYLGTGPQGKIYMLDSRGRKPQLLYNSRDKNILSLAIGRDGFIYAGSDTRGLVYKINPRDKTVTVLYDSDQPEIAALLFSGDGNLYAAATSAEIVQTQLEFAAQSPLAGRPEVEPEIQEEIPEEGTGVKLEIANTREDSSASQVPKKQISALKVARPAEASHVYGITKDGYVTDIFTEVVVIFCLAEQEQKLLIGTGNDGRIFTIDPASEQRAIVYQDQYASQISAVVVSGDDVYLGTANPAKLIKLSRTYALNGTYASDLIDAGQPADWGKLQIDADIPQGCKVMVACRSGNVNDVNDPTFSKWTEPTEVTEPVQLECPVGRFCQYKLFLQTEDSRKSPLIRAIAVADTVPNLAPRVESVSAERIESLGKAGRFKISYKAKDDNDDELIYKIDFRKAGRASWIKLEKELESNSFEWDGRTAEDGRYEFRVTASDERSNTTATKLTGSRITEPVVVDNTGPVIKKYSIENDKKSIELKLQVSDELSAISRVEYTVDSNDDWISAVPDDLVYDTTNEDFTIGFEQLDAGGHIIAIKVSDAVGNTTYKTFEVTVAGN